MRELHQLQLEGNGGGEELIDDKIKRRWLDNIARMPDHRIPKQIFLGWSSVGVQREDGRM